MCVSVCERFFESVSRSGADFLGREQLKKERCFYWRIRERGIRSPPRKNAGVPSARVTSVEFRRTKRKKQKRRRKKEKKKGEI